MAETAPSPSTATNPSTTNTTSDKTHIFTFAEGAKYKGLANLKNKIPNQAEEALRHRLRNFANYMCKEYMGIFAQCSKTKTVSVVWACRAEHEMLTKCLNEIVNETNLNQLRHAYINGDLMKKYNYDDLHAEVHRRIDEKRVNESKVNSENNSST